MNVFIFFVPPNDLHDPLSNRTAANYLQLLIIIPRSSNGSRLHRNQETIVGSHVHWTAATVIDSSGVISTRSVISGFLLRKQIVPNHVKINIRYLTIG